MRLVFHLCHADAIDDTASYGQDDIHSSVNLGEKVMKASSDISVVISFFPLSSVSFSALSLHHVVLLVNVKWVNVGIRAC